MTDAKVTCPWALLALLFATFVVLCSATLLLPHDRYIRYQQLGETIQFHALWDYHRIQFDETPIDIAIIGNSRLQAGISAPQLQEGLSRQLGRPIHVANLSLAQEGRDAHYAVAKQLLANHPEVQLIILSAIEQMPRESHPAFPTIADPGDVVSAPVLLNRSYFANLATLPFRQISLTIQSLLPSAFDVSGEFDPTRYAGSDLDTSKSFDTPTGNHVDRDSIHAATELMPTARERFESITPPMLPSRLADWEFAVERSYTRRIARLAEANDTRLAFLYVPIFHFDPPLDNQPFYDELGTVLDARFLATDPRNYSDYGHTNRIGSARLGQWLAMQMQERGMLAAGRSPPPVTQTSEAR